MINSRTTKWEELASRMEERNAYNFWLEKLKERIHLEDIKVDGKITLKCDLEKRGMKTST
jgi:hypothetical protein